MARVSLSGTEKSIETIWSWYEDQKEALRDFRNKIIIAFVTPNPNINQKFLTLTIEELNIYFEESFEELEHYVAFDLIAATEGNLRADFYTRVYEKDKSDLGRCFRGIYKIKENRVSLEEDIIKNWKIHEPTSKSDMSDLLGMLHYRHWLAHGRYWSLNKQGRRYSADESYTTSEKILIKIS
jgi:hypothetical protein